VGSYCQLSTHRPAFHLLNGSNEDRPGQEAGNCNRYLIKGMVSFIKKWSLLTLKKVRKLYINGSEY
jgi:hypothetical protein